MFLLRTGLKCKFYITAGVCKAGFIHAESDCLGVTHKIYEDGTDNSVVSAACAELDSTATPMPKSSVCHSKGKDSRSAIKVIYSIVAKCTFTKIL